MTIAQLIKSVRAAYSEAKTSQFSDIKYKIKAFIILVKLHIKCNSGFSKQPVLCENILGYRVSARAYEDLLVLFREIALKLQYHFVIKKTAPVIIDGGANIGMTVLLYKLLYPKSLILAFEPDPENYRLLVKNIKQNKIRNVKTFHAGFTAHEEILNFYPSTNSSLTSSFKPATTSNNPVLIQSVKLSSLLSQGVFDMVKLDVEGAEWEIMNDLEHAKVLTNSEQYMVATHHPSSLNSHKLMQQMTEHGFKYQLRQPHYETHEKKSFDSLILFQKASRPTE
jgi:FkbM family methyltransferase